MSSACELNSLGSGFVSQRNQTTVELQDQELGGFRVGQTVRVTDGSEREGVIVRFRRHGSMDGADVQFRPVVVQYCIFIHLFRLEPVANQTKEHTE